MVSTVKLASYHQFLGRAFVGQYNINTKVNEYDSVDRVFDKDKSIFKDWKLDKPKLIQEGFLDEISHWNVLNFVKDENEVEQIVELMKKHCEFLKTLFIIKSSASNFPVIRWLAYESMVKEWNIIDA